VYRSKEPLGWLRPECKSIDQDGLVSNNDAEEFRIESNGGDGCALLNESEALSKKTTEV
jgi:hypothetical protein